MTSSDIIRTFGVAIVGTVGDIINRKTQSIDHIWVPFGDFAIFAQSPKSLRIGSQSLEFS